MKFRTFSTKIWDFLTKTGYFWDFLTKMGYFRVFGPGLCSVPVVWVPGCAVYPWYGSRVSVVPVREVPGVSGASQRGPGWWCHSGVVGGGATVESLVVPQWCQKQSILDIFVKNQPKTRVFLHILTVLTNPGKHGENHCF